MEPIAQPEPIAMKDEESISTSTEDVTVVATAAPTEVKRVAVLSAGNPFLSVGAVVLAVVSAGLLWLIHKGFRLRRYILAGEHFIAHHIHLDLTVLAIVYLGFVLLSTSGAVR